MLTLETLPSCTCLFGCLEIICGTRIEASIEGRLEHSTGNKYPRIVVAIREIRNAAKDSEMPGYDVVSRQIGYGVRGNMGGCRADGLIAVLKILRSDGVHHQTDLVQSILPRRDSLFEYPVRCIGGDPASLTGNDAARKASIQQARIGEGVKVEARPYRREQAQQIVVTLEFHPATASIARVDIDGFGLRELFGLDAVIDIDLKHTHIVVQPRARPTMHTGFIGQVLGGVWVVRGGEVTERTRDIEIAQGTEALRNIRVSLVAMTEIIANTDAEQRDVPGVGCVYQKWMRSERLICAQFFTIEPRGCNQMKVLEAEHVLREQRAIRGLARIVVERCPSPIVLAHDRVGGDPLVVRTSRRVQRVTDGQCVAGAPAMQPSTIQTGVVEALAAERGAGACGRDVGGVGVRACPQILITRPELLGVRVFVAEFVLIREHGRVAIRPQTIVRRRGLIVIRKKLRTGHEARQAAVERIGLKIQAQDLRVEPVTKI